MALFFIIFPFSIQFFCQESSIVHYQRREKIDQVILPNDKYNSADFILVVPDSVYSAGRISVKFMKIANYKSTVKFEFSENRYTSTSYILSKKNSSSFESDVLKTANVISLQEEDLKAANLKLSKTKEGRKYKYSFISIK